MRIIRLKQAGRKVGGCGSEPQIENLDNFPRIKLLAYFEDEPVYPSGPPRRVTGVCAQQNAVCRSCLVERDLHFVWSFQAVGTYSNDGIHRVGGPSVPGPGALRRLKRRQRRHTRKMRRESPHKATRATKAATAGLISAQSNWELISFGA